MQRGWKGRCQITKAGLYRQHAAKAAADQLAHAGNDGQHAVTKPLQSVAEDHQQAVEAEQHTHDAEVLDRARRDGRVGIAQHQPHRVGLMKKITPHATAQ